MSPRPKLVLFVAALGAAVVPAPARAAEPSPRPSPSVEAPPSLVPLPVPSPSGRPDRRPPKAGEVVAALQRVFGALLPRAAVQAERALAGDFNADESYDLIVPATAGAELVRRSQGELPMWTVQDPAGRRSAAEVAGELHAGDAVLVVLHGHGPAGWRNPEARQAYLLALHGQAPRAVRRFAATPLAGAPGISYLDGDVAADDAGKRLLYWSGARYLWQDEKPGPAR